MVIPIHNEAPILEHCLTGIIEGLGGLDRPFEIVLCENGSSDDTLVAARALAAGDQRLRVLTSPVADYGEALRFGITNSHHDQVVIFNIDYWSATFVQRALDELRAADMVIGSKRLRGSLDERPLMRRAITASFNGFLRVCFGFRGTDTHGLKAFSRDAVLPIVERCTTDGWIFDTELVLLAERRGLRIVEVPVTLAEIRAPGYRSLIARVPRTLKAIDRMRQNLARTPRQ